MEEREAVNHVPVVDSPSDGTFATLQVKLMMWLRSVTSPLAPPLNWFCDFVASNDACGFLSSKLSSLVRMEKQLPEKKNDDQL